MLGTLQCSVVIVGIREYTLEPSCRPCDCGLTGVGSFIHAMHTVRVLLQKLAQPPRQHVAAESMGFDGGIGEPLPVKD